MEKYIESHLSESFAQETHTKAKELIEKGQSFSIIGMPAVGVSLFLKFLASHTYATFIHLDIYELPEFTKEQFLTLFYFKLTQTEKKGVTFQDCKNILLEKLQQEQRIVVIINKFDLLEKEFSESFLGQFRTITHGTDGRLSFIFSVTKQYIDYVPHAIAGTNMHIFSRYIYLPPYETKDIQSLMELHSPELLKHPGRNEAITLSGNHIQLLQLILRSDMPNILSRDPYIKVLFQQIIETLTKERRRIVKKIASGKEGEHDQFLFNIGMIKTNGGSSILFSPLFSEYLLEEKNHHFSFKERKLFSLLKNNLGKIISKKKIFDTVWEDDINGATDWALDALIYRLRRHPYLKEKGYSILNHKKLGFQLIRE